MPELFGIHKNGDITSVKLQINQLLDCALMTVPREISSGDEDEDKIIERLCDNVLKEVPKELNLLDVSRLRPVIRENSLNTVINQDCLR